MNRETRQLANDIANILPVGMPMSDITRALMHVLAGVYVANEDEFDVADMHWLSPELGHAFHGAAIDCIRKAKQTVASRN